MRRHIRYKAVVSIYKCHDVVAIRVCHYCRVLQLLLRFLQRRIYWSFFYRLFSLLRCRRCAWLRLCRCLITIICPIIIAFIIVLLSLTSSVAVYILSGSFPSFSTIVQHTHTDKSSRPKNNSERDSVKRVRLYIWMNIYKWSFSKRKVFSEIKKNNNKRETLYAINL